MAERPNYRLEALPVRGFSIAESIVLDNPVIIKIAVIFGAMQTTCSRDTDCDCENKCDHCYCVSKDRKRREKECYHSCGCESDISDWDCNRVKAPCHRDYEEDCLINLFGGRKCACEDACKDGG